MTFQRGVGGQVDSRDDRRLSRPRTRAFPVRPGETGVSSNLRDAHASRNTALTGQSEGMDRDAVLTPRYPGELG